MLPFPRATRIRDLNLKIFNSICTQPPQAVTFLSIVLASFLRVTLTFSEPWRVLRPSRRLYYLRLKRPRPHLRHYLHLDLRERSPSIRSPLSAQRTAPQLLVRLYDLRRVHLPPWGPITMLHICNRCSHLSTASYAEETAMAEHYPQCRHRIICPEPVL